MPSPRAMITIRPCRSAKWARASRHPSPPPRYGPRDVDRHRDGDQCHLPAAAEVGAPDEQDRRDHDGPGQSENGPGDPLVVAAGDVEQRQMHDPHHHVGCRGEHRHRRAPGVVEEVGHQQRKDHDRGHRHEHRHLHQPLVDANGGAQPAVGHPRPPQQGSQQQSARETECRVVVSQVCRHLADPVHEDEVEEQLQCRDLVPGRVPDQAGVTHGSSRNAAGGNQTRVSPSHRSALIPFPTTVASRVMSSPIL